MSLIKWTPFFDPFEEMEKSLSNFSPALQNNNIFVPAIDMYEDENNVIIETQLAGIDLDKVDISINKDTVCIKGESEKKSEVDEKNYYRKEIRRGNFIRNIQLPSIVEGDKAEAIAEDGVLKITIPKASEKESKIIKIQTKKK